MTAITVGQLITVPPPSDAAQKKTYKIDVCTLNMNKKMTFTPLKFLTCKTAVRIIIAGTPSYNIV